MKVPDKFAGKKGKCPGCGTMLRIPGQKVSSAPAAPAKPVAPPPAPTASPAVGDLVIPDNLELDLEPAGSAPPIIDDDLTLDLPGEPAAAPTAPALDIPELAPVTPAPAALPRASAPELELADDGAPAAPGGMDLAVAEDAVPAMAPPPAAAPRGIECPQCRAPMAPGEAFCGGCGARVGGGAPAADDGLALSAHAPAGPAGPAAEPTGPPPERKLKASTFRPSGLWFGYLVKLGIIAAVVAGLYFGGMYGFETYNRMTFDSHMASATELMKMGNLSAAETELGEARALFPKDDELAKAYAQLEEAKKKASPGKGADDPVAKAAKSIVGSGLKKSVPGKTPAAGKTVAGAKTPEEGKTVAAKTEAAKDEPARPTNDLDARKTFGALKLSMQAPKDWTVQAQGAAPTGSLTLTGPETEGVVPVIEVRLLEVPGGIREFTENVKKEWEAKGLTLTGQKAYRFNDSRNLTLLEFEGLVQGKKGPETGKSMQWVFNIGGKKCGVVGFTLPDSVYDLWRQPMELSVRTLKTLK